MQVIDDIGDFLIFARQIVSIKSRRMTICPVVGFCVCVGSRKNNSSKRSGPIL
jgi:hypothetical protein